MYRRMLWLLLFAFPASTFGDSWHGGFSRSIITPEGSLFLTGYASRDHAAEGKAQDLFCRVAALRDPSGKTIVLVSLDLIGVPAGMAAYVCEKIEAKHKIPREQIMICCSHTHCGPALDDELQSMLFLPEEEYKKIQAYQLKLNEMIVSGILEAIENLEPIELTWGIGSATFASPRRPPIGIGPYDHEVPVLAARGKDGNFKGFVFGYACHNTTLSFYQYCGDYAGFAQLALEERIPGSVACFFTGCGGDQNPLPRRKIELAQKYGNQLADAVTRVLESRMTKIESNVLCGLKKIDLPFAHVPGKQELEQRSKSSNKHEAELCKQLLKQLESGKQLDDSYPYPIQVWKFGSVPGKGNDQELQWVALGGEITVEYSLRLKAELGPGKTFVTGYANDVMAYIPSERILREGGYEGASSMIYYRFATTWAPGIEDRICTAVNELAKSLAK